MRLLLLFFISILFYSCAVKNIRPTQAVAPQNIPRLTASFIEIPVVIADKKIETLLSQSLPNPVAKGKTEEWTIQLKGQEKQETTPSFWQKITAPVTTWVDKNFSANAHLVYQADLYDLDLEFEGNQVIAKARIEVDSDLKIDRAIPFSNKRKSNHIPCPLSAQLELRGYISILEETAQLHIDLDQDKGTLVFEKICSDQSLASLNLPQILQPLLAPIQKTLRQKISQVLTQQIQAAITQNKAQLSFDDQIQELVKELDQPYELDQGIWLTPHVEEVFISKFEGQTINNQNQLTFSIGTQAKPIVSIGKKPTKENFKKINLKVRAVRNKSSIHIQGRLGLDTAAHQLQSYLKNYVEQNYAQHGYTIGMVSIYPNYRKAVVAIELLKAKNQKHKATIYLAGIPKYRIQQKEIYLDSLQFTTKTKNILLQSAKWLLQPKIMKQLEANTQFAISEQLNTIQNQLNDFQIKEQLGTLSGEFDVVDLESIFITQQTFEVILKVEGKLHFEWNE